MVSSLPSHGGIHPFPVMPDDSIPIPHSCVLQPGPDTVTSTVLPFSRVWLPWLVILCSILGAPQGAFDMQSGRNPSIPICRTCFAFGTLWTSSGDVPRIHNYIDRSKYNEPLYSQLVSSSANIVIL